MAYEPARAELALSALADPTRRAIVGHLRNGPRSVGDLAGNLPVSRPAVSQHLRVLTDSGLLTVHQRGTRRIYTLAPVGVTELRHYLEQLWDDALSAYAAEAHRQADTSAKGNPS